MVHIHEYQEAPPPRPDYVQQGLQFLKRYLKNPVATMNALPDWEWPMLLGFYASVAGICGLIGGILGHHMRLIISGAIIFPISATVGAFVATGFIYYTFTFFFHREIEIKRLFTIVILSLMPFLAIQVFSAWLLPLNLIGFLVSSILLVVGLSENTQVDRRRIFKMVGALYLIYVAFWIYSSISQRSEKEKYKELASPEAIETIKKEMGN